MDLFGLCPGEGARDVLTAQQKAQWQSSTVVCKKRDLWYYPAWRLVILVDLLDLQLEKHKLVAYRFGYAIVWYILLEASWRPNGHSCSKRQVKKEGKLVSRL